MLNSILSKIIFGIVLIVLGYKIILLEKKYDNLERFILKTAPLTEFDLAPTNFSEKYKNLYRK